MFRIFNTESKEERMCKKYSNLMQRSFRIAPADKERSDRLNSKARKILNELRRMNCSALDFQA